MVCLCWFHGSSSVELQQWQTQFPLWYSNQFHNSALETHTHTQKKNTYIYTTKIYHMCWHWQNFKGNHFHTINPIKYTIKLLTHLIIVLLMSTPGMLCVSHLHRTSHTRTTASTCNLNLHLKLVLLATDKHCARMVIMLLDTHTQSIDKLKIKLRSISSKQCNPATVFPKTHKTIGGNGVNSHATYERGLVLDSQRN